MWGGDESAALSQSGLGDLGRSEISVKLWRLPHSGKDLLLPPSPVMSSPGDSAQCGYVIMPCQIGKQPAKPSGLQHQSLLLGCMGPQFQACFSCVHGSHLWGSSMKCASRRLLEFSCMDLLLHCWCLFLSAVWCRMPCWLACSVIVVLCA